MGQNLRHSLEVWNDLLEGVLELGKIGEVHVLPELVKCDFHRSLSCPAGDPDPSLVGVTRSVLRNGVFQDDLKITASDQFSRRSSPPRVGKRCQQGGRNNRFLWDRCE